MSRNRANIIIGAGIMAFVAAILAVATWKYENFLYNGLDLAIYHQVFWNTVHGDLFASSLHPPSYLGDHAEWIILALAPLYAIVRHPLTLVFLQAGALGICAIPLWMIARERIGDRRITGLIPVLWLLNPFVWNLTLYEFHAIVFAIPFLLFAARYYLALRITPFLVCSMAAMLCREDVPLAVAGFSLLSLVLRRRARWSLAPLGLAAAVFLADQWVIGMANPDGAYKYLAYYRWLGETPGGMIWNAIVHPLAVLRHFLTFGNLELAIAFLLPLLALPVLRARYLLIGALPLLALLMTDTGGSFLILQTQYSALLLPGAFIAAIMGIDRILKTRLAPLVPMLLVIATVFTFFRLGPGGALISAPASPDGMRAQAIRQAVSLIPPEASVLSSFDPLVAVSGRTSAHALHYTWLGVRQFGYARHDLAEPPEYLLLDAEDFRTFARIYPNVPWAAAHVPDGDDRFRELLARGGYGITYESGEIALFERGTGDGELPARFTAAAYSALPDGRLILDELGITRFVHD